MAPPAEKRKMTAAEFIGWESQQPERYELHCGEVFPHEIYGMVGARQNHVIVAMNVAAALKAHLRGQPCRALMNDMKVEAAADSVFYPDILVTCDADDLASELVVRHPKAIVEILSPSTATYDRGDKFVAYRRIAALQEYALIDPDTRRIEVFRRLENDDWLLVTSESSRGLVLKSLGFEVSPAVVFEDVGPVGEG